MIFRLIICLLCFSPLLNAHPAGLPDSTICTNEVVNDFNFGEAGINTVCIITGNRILRSAITSFTHSAQQKKEVLFMRHFLNEQSLNITAHPAPDLAACDTFANGITTFDLTDNDIIIISAQSGATVSYHETVGDAQTGTAAIPSPQTYTNTTNPQSIYARIQDGIGNFDTTSFELIVYPNPVPGPVSDMALCDSGNGSAQFDLNIPGNQIINGQADMNISFYLTQGQAEAGTTGQLPVLYTHIGGAATIFERLEDNITGCFTVVAFTIEVVSAPPITSPITDYMLCDDDQDGVEVFDLTSKESEILGTIPPGSVTITYHESVSDRNAGIALVPANAYISGGQTIYFRVTYNDPPACFSDGQFELGLHPPVAFNPPAPLQVCDEGVANGIATFNLNLATTQITGNNANLNVTYYLTQAEAETGNVGDQLPMMYQNQNPYFQTIYVRVVNLTTGCYSIAPLDLVVEVSPAAFDPDPLTFCDHDNDGFGTFTLTDADNQITGGAMGVNVTYHLTQADAHNGVWPQTSPFYNTVQYTQTLYARVENNNTGCFTTVELVLQVIPLPSPTNPTPLEECDPDSNGFAMFDLNSKIPEILNNEPDVVITFHETLIDAQDGNFALTSPYSNIVQYQQTIYVRAENTITGCFATVELVLIVNDSPNVPSVLDDLVICSEDPPGIGILFDLTLQEWAIYGTQDPTLFNLSYHLTQGDAQTDTNAIANPSSFANITNPQTIYIRLEDIYNGCFATTSFDLIVAQLYIDQSPNNIYINEGDGDGIAVFDLTVNEPMMLGTQNAADFSFSYFESLIDAENNINAILNPVQFVNTANPQTIYVRKELNLITACYLISSFEIETDEFLNIHIPDSFQITLYPNPVKGDLFLSTIDTINKLEVFTLNGQKLKLPLYNLESNQWSIDFSGLDTGVYLVKIITPNGLTVKRVIKQ